MRPESAGLISTLFYCPQGTEDVMENSRLVYSTSTAPSHRTWGAGRDNSHAQFVTEAVADYQQEQRRIKRAIYRPVRARWKEEVSHV